MGDYLRFFASGTNSNNDGRVVDSGAVSTLKVPGMLIGTVFIHRYLVYIPYMSRIYPVDIPIYEDREKHGINPGYIWL